MKLAIKDGYVIDEDTKKVYLKAEDDYMLVKNCIIKTKKADVNFLLINDSFVYVNNRIRIEESKNTFSKKNFFVQSLGKYYFLSSNGLKEFFNDKKSDCEVYFSNSSFLIIIANNKTGLISIFNTQKEIIVFQDKDVEIEDRVRVRALNKKFENFLFCTIKGVNNILTDKGDLVFKDGASFFNILSAYNKIYLEVADLNNQRFIFDLIENKKVESFPINKKYFTIGEGIGIAFGYCDSSHYIDGTENTLYKKGKLFKEDLTEIDEFDEMFSFYTYLMFVKGKKTIVYNNESFIKITEIDLQVTEADFLPNQLIVVTGKNKKVFLYNKNFESKYSEQVFRNVLKRERFISAVGDYKTANPIFFNKAGVKIQADWINFSLNSIMNICDTFILTEQQILDLFESTSIKSKVDELMLVDTLWRSQLFTETELLAILKKKGISLTFLNGHKNYYGIIEKVGKNDLKKIPVEELTKSYLMNIWSE